MDIVNGALAVLAIILILITIRIVRHRGTTADALIPLGISLSLIGKITFDLSNFSRFFQVQFSLGHVIFGVGVSIVVIALSFLVIKRYRDRRQSRMITFGKEYFETIWDSVLWEIEKSPDVEMSEMEIVTGPLCKTCKMLMDPQWTYITNPASRRKSIPNTIIGFVCPNCGNTVTPPNDLKNDTQIIKRRVYESYRADKRKQEMASKKLVA